MGEIQYRAGQLFRRALTAHHFVARRPAESIRLARGVDLRLLVDAAGDVVADPRADATFLGHEPHRAPLVAAVEGLQGMIADALAEADFFDLRHVIGGYRTALPPDWRDD